MLKSLGLKNIQVIKPSIDEKSFFDKNALKKSVRNIAMQKAVYVKKMHKDLKDSTIIAGDTIENLFLLNIIILIELRILKIFF